MVLLAAANNWKRERPMIGTDPFLSGVELLGAGAVIGVIARWYFERNLSAGSRVTLQDCELKQEACRGLLKKDIEGHREDLVEFMCSTEEGIKIRSQGRRQTEIYLNVILLTLLEICGNLGISKKEIESLLREKPMAGER